MARSMANKVKLGLCHNDLYLGCLAGQRSLLKPIRVHLDIIWLNYPES